MVREIQVLPDFRPDEIGLAPIPVFAYDRTLKDELKAGALTAADALDMLEWMLSVNAFEQMIVTLRMQSFEPLRATGFLYRGPTHLSVGQEATSVGACSAIRWTDKITSSHRGHGDSIAKGYVAIKQRSDEELRRWLGPRAAGQADGDALRELAKEEHVYRTAAELFGKADGYCRGRGGGMHIADFASGHLGANAIVGGSVGIATGAALTQRYLGTDGLVLCFAGDGAYSNGVVLESLNFACMDQFVNELADAPRGLPIIYAIVNNQYGMTGQQFGEVTGVRFLAQRAAGFARDAMHAEVVNGMDVLAVRDSMARAAALAREGHGPILRELICYRFHGHSLTDPRTEYRSKEEEQAWREVEPIQHFERQVVAAGVATEDEVAALHRKVEERHERATVRAAKAPDPDPAEVTRFVFTDARADSVPAPFAHPKTLQTPPQAARKEDGTTTFREALREALVEEMLRDERVVVYGEDVADYGGAFKVTKGLIEAFGRRRVFNTAISEAAIVGTAVGAAMTGLRPVIELMYSDFELQAGDQLFNQAAKWHYMSGGQTTVPLVIRSSVGAGKGYGGQHSQALEAHACHTPGIYVVCPSTPYDAKGLLKSAIRDDNPVLFVESQALYNERGVVPPEDYLVPLGRAAVRREGADVTIVAWSWMAHLMAGAAQTLAGEHGVQAELVDLRSLVPLDMETVLASVRKTGRCIVACQACRTGSFAAEVAARIQEDAFDYLDAPVLRIGSADAISPQSEVLEKAYLPGVPELVKAALAICPAGR